MNKPTRNSSFFGSASDEWGTPQWLFDYYNSIYSFTVDVCATAESAKCARYFDEATDGLKQSWAGERCWMNPPYGKAISDWVEKAHTESLLGAVVVGLIPARTCSRWWHDYANHGTIDLLRGRLRFENAPLRDGRANYAPFPSAIVTWLPPIDMAKR